ncbi:MAG: TatD family hydrolase [Actinomycetota bacterium]|nr:TatD family hydrolase [Actinomycetota bacterium]
MSENVLEEIKTYFIDTHMHLDMIEGKSPEKVLEEAEAENVRYVINIGSSMEGSLKSVEYAKNFDNVYATVGIHPHYADKFGRKEEKLLDNLIKNNKKIVAVGETGFDFFKNPISKEEQERTFVTHIELAVKHGIPIVIHDRDAHKETINALKNFIGMKDFKGVLHCFSGDADFALKCIGMGLYVSFTGVVTFKNAKQIKEAAKIVPIEKIFIETDSPYLAPHPYRGQENYPSYVRYVAQEIARLKEIDIDDVAKITSNNAESFFNLKNK